jgi:hypothetical protein
MALPLIAFLRNGSTKVKNFNVSRITDTSWTETSFKDTDEDATEGLEDVYTEDCNYRETGKHVIGQSC